MKIALIECDVELPTDGIRLVSALLKKAGHTVYFIFLPVPHFDEHGRTGFAALKQIFSLCDAVMFSVYSYQSHRAAVLTKHIHDSFSAIPVIWGGPHCISAPELSLRHADAVCYGEAEACIADYVSSLEKGDRTPDTGNMAFKRNGEIVINKPLPPFHDLDSLPFYDYDLENQFILEKDLAPMSRDIMRRTLSGYPMGNPTLSVLTSRGCPHCCSYCNNSRYISLFGKNSIRAQSVGRFMDEIESMVNRFDFFKGIFFGDDDFFVRSCEEIRAFAERYKKNVNLPFAIATSANTFRPEKFEPLLDCGLKRLVLGVQTVNQRVLKEIFNRNIDPRKTAAIALETTRYYKSHGFRVHLDFISDNPYETREEILADYRFMIRLSPHIRFQIHNLVFFPGTPLYEKAVKDAVIKPFDENEFRSYLEAVQYHCHYEMFLYMFAGFLGRTGARALVPRFLLEMIALKPVRAVMNLLPRPLMRNLVREFTPYLLLKFSSSYAFFRKIGLLHKQL